MSARWPINLITSTFILGEANKTINDYKYRMQKAEQEIASLQASLARSETQVIRYKSTAEASEKSEADLKTERRKLQREVSWSSWVRFRPGVARKFHNSLFYFLFMNLNFTADNDRVVGWVSLPIDSCFSLFLIDFNGIEQGNALLKNWGSFGGFVIVLKNCWSLWSLPGVNLSMRLETNLAKVVHAHLTWVNNRTLPINLLFYWFLFSQFNLLVEIIKIILSGFTSSCTLLTNDSVQIYWTTFNSLGLKIRSAWKVLLSCFIKQLTSTCYELVRRVAR